MSVAFEDILQMSYIIAKSAYNSNQDYLVSKFAQDAISKDQGKNPEISAVIRILDGMACFKSKNYNQAASRLLEVQLTPEMSDGSESVIDQILSANDLAYYICLSALSSCSRQELKNVMKSNNFVTLTSSVSDTAQIIEEFLNGNFKAFQRSLLSIQRQMQFDQYVGKYTRHSDIFKQIRLKALS